MALREVDKILKEYNAVVEDAKLIEERRRESAEAKLPAPASLIDSFRDFERQGWRNVSQHKLRTVIPAVNTVLPLNPNPAKR
jgi:hypothetical protein